MDLQTTSSLVRCRVFLATLGEILRAWLRSLPSRSIGSWEECQRRFLGQYRALRRQLAPPCHLATVFQKSSESLKDYIARFRREVSNVESPSDESILTAISASLRKDGKLYESIYKSLVTDLGEFYERAAKEIQWEEAFGSKKSAGIGRKPEVLAETKKETTGEIEGTTVMIGLAIR
ncbi:uncharacterized protein LOC127811205 [Diospyros lotus]|uniref:uncharacterized protein LOC127811205 n=1 Tax=Diospyros lotus TaxID=55363 RepID=UPI002258629A|nr:uncharacterized protein LOC127811205 [Diospyros lotus]